MYITFSDKIEINKLDEINKFIKHIDSSLQNYTNSHDFSYYKIDSNTRGINVSKTNNHVSWYNVIYNINHKTQTIDITIIAKSNDFKVKTISVRLDEISNENITNIVISHIDNYIS